MAHLTRWQYLASIDFPHVFEMSGEAGSPTISAIRRFPAELVASTFFNTFQATVNNTNWFGLNAPTDFQQPIPIRNDFNFVGGATIEDDVKESFGAYLVAISVCSGFRFKNTSRIDKEVTEIDHHGRGLLEIECRWKLEDDPMPIDAATIVHQYSQLLYHHDPRRGYPQWFWAIGQCVGYLVLYRRRSIILSTLAYFYVISINYVGAVAQVEISDRIAVSGDKTTIALGGHPTVQLSATQLALSDIIMDHVNAAMPNLVPTASKSELVYSLCFLFALHEGVRSPAMAAEPVFVVPHLSGGRHGSEVSGGADDTVMFNGTLEYVGAGRSGVVYSSNYRGCKVAFKFAEPTEKQDEFDEDALSREVCLYEEFKECQGLLIPKLVEAIVMSGNAKGFCMEFLAPLPCDFKDWSEDQRCEAARVLSLLLDRGLWQNDIRAANFGVNASGSIVMFDLEDCSLINVNDESEKQGCLKTIESILYKSC